MTATRPDPLRVSQVQCIAAIGYRQPSSHRGDKDSLLSAISAAVKSPRIWIVIALRLKLIAAGTPARADESLYSDDANTHINTIINHIVDNDNNEH